MTRRHMLEDLERSTLIARNKNVVSRTEQSQLFHYKEKAMANIEIVDTGHSKNSAQMVRIAHSSLLTGNGEH